MAGFGAKESISRGEGEQGRFKDENPNPVVEGNAQDFRP